VKQHEMCPDDEQFAQVPIAHLRNAPELRLAARRVLLGSQSEKGGELARAGEAGHILNGRRHRRGDDRAEAGNAHQPARRFIPLRKLCDGVLKPRNPVVEISQLHHQRRQHLTHFKRDCLVAGLDQLDRLTNDRSCRYRSARVFGASRRARYDGATQRSERIVKSLAKFESPQLHQTPKSVGLGARDAPIMRR
jgi:hypothetical protein